MAHLIIPLIGGLSRLPMILHTPPQAGADIPPPQLMLKMYLALKKRAGDAVLPDWATLDPTSDYFPYLHQQKYCPAPCCVLFSPSAGRSRRL